MNKPAFKQNSHGIKNSNEKYRNIQGVHYINWTFDTTIFDEEIQKAKAKKIKKKIIDNELYIERIER
jgi:hypothetical protein